MDFNLDSTLSIISLALSIGGLVPIFRLQDQRKALLLAVMISVLVLLSTISLYRVFQHQKEVEYVSGEVINVLGKGPKTINQIDQNIYHIDYAILLEAVEDLVRTDKIHYESMKLFDVQQNEYTVSVYSVIQK
ncbi:conserved hypothetical protein, membrane [Candidatus Magnetomorum sp. HK-1]|nr:conserved hypothetical protein, membrane [Candidatus Magnetomorum sp. HK-1]